MTTLPPDANNDGVNQGSPSSPEGQVPPAAPQQPGGYQQPPAGGGYQPPQQPPQQPPAGGYQQPQAQQGSDPVSMVTLNYWLSVFFAWLPALIFYFIEKDKGNQLANAYHRDNLNFSLVRTIVYVATLILGIIPYIGWILALLLWLASVVLFVFHIVAAAKAPANFRAGKGPEFIFNLEMVK